MGIIIAGMLALLLILWTASCRRRLAVMEENVSNAMAQIGVQISSRFDVLTALLDLAKEYAAYESQTLLEAVRSNRSAITAASSPEDVQKQEGIISVALGCISAVAEKYPELKANENYSKYINTMDGYKKLVRTSRLIYNDSVTKLNRELRMFPTSLIAGVLGFHQKDYLEAERQAGISGLV